MQKLNLSLKNISELKSIKNFLKPHTKRAYLVGGSVRDLLLGREIYDFDLEIYDILPKDFEILMQKLGAQGFGKSFFVYKWQNFDLALPRTENKISNGHTGFEITFCQDEKLAAKRRDFTINSMMTNIFNYEFLDFYGGFNDLNSKILRHIDEKSFKEDSLRVLRGIGFAARFDFEISQNCLNLMRKMPLCDLSRDRINAELYKFFRAPNLALGFHYLSELELLKEIFGVEFGSKEFENLLKNARKFIKDEGLFLYLYLNFFNINKDGFFKKTGLKNELLKSASQPFHLGEISYFELAKIALEMPLKNWLGLWDEKRVKMAKKLGLFENKFQSQISAQELIKKGFCGKMLGQKLKNERLCELEKFVKNKVLM